MTDLTPDKLDQIEKAAKERLDQIAATLRRCRVSKTAIEYGTRNERDLLALVARVRELEAQVKEARQILDDAASGGALTAHQRRTAIDGALKALGEES